jgi:hypothetical protein
MIKGFVGRRMKRTRGEPSLPFYYRFTKFFSIFFVLFLLLLTLAGTNPGTSVAALARANAWLFVLVALFLYLHFLAMEDEALKLLRTKKRLEEQERLERLLLNASNRADRADSPEKIARLALATLTYLLPLNRGFAALVGPDGSPEVVTAWHLARDQAVTAARLMARAPAARREADRRTV